MNTPSGNIPDGNIPGGNIPSRRTLLKGALAGGAALLLPQVLPQFPAWAGSTSNSDISHGSRTNNEIALTFHGAGDPTLARKILQIAKSSQIDISVLAVGTWLKANPAIGHEILDAGFTLGNHTMNHKTMTRLSAASAHAEITACKKVLAAISPNIPMIFRPSGTPKSNAIIRKAANENGYANCITYDVDSLDYQDPSPAAIAKNVANGIKSGSIVSLHFGHVNTPKALPLIIEHLAGLNLKPVTLAKLIASTN